jgi:hypothetical protein
MSTDLRLRAVAGGARPPSGLVGGGRGAHALRSSAARARCHSQQPSECQPPAAAGAASTVRAAGHAAGARPAPPRPPRPTCGTCRWRAGRSAAAPAPPPPRRPAPCWPRRGGGGGVRACAAPCKGEGRVPRQNRTWSRRGRGPAPPPGRRPPDELARGGLVQRVDGAAADPEGCAHKVHVGALALGAKRRVHDHLRPRRLLSWRSCASRCTPRSRRQSPRAPALAGPGRCGLRWRPPCLLSAGAARPAGPRRTAPGRSAQQRRQR